MFVKETGGPVDAMWPLVSWVDALLMRELKVNGVGWMHTAIQPRPNVRRVRKSQNEMRADRVNEVRDDDRVAGIREPQGVQ
ncbi:MAG: hypothetical protein CV089_05775 [Nitrospira sp. WS110]|nr:hypothetical protein [Nitrospira sp. WS110]